MQGLSVAYVVARHCEVPMVFARAWTAFAVCTLNETDLVDYGALEDNYFERNWVFVFWFLYRLIRNCIHLVLMFVANSSFLHTAPCLAVNRGNRVQEESFPCA